MYILTNLKIDLQVSDNTYTADIFSSSETDLLYYRTLCNYELLSVIQLQSVYIINTVNLDTLDITSARILYDFVVKMYHNQNIDTISLFDVTNCATLFVAIHGSGYGSVLLSKNTIAYAYGLLKGLN